MFLQERNIIQIFVDKEKCSRREEIEYRCWQVGFVAEVVLPFPSFLMF